MTDLTKYTQDAIRTESHVDTIMVNELLLISVLQQMTALGGILDQIKKNAFYGKKFDMMDMSVRMGIAEEAFKTLATVTGEEMNDQKHDMGINPRIFHAVIGMATESVELLEALRFHENPMDTINMLEEIGDSSWYQAILIDEAGGVWDDILDRNIEKLRKRFPEKFTSEAAIGRDTDAEREILDRLHHKE